MPYIVVRNEQSVLSRVSPDALLSWLGGGVSKATDYRYAITFETFSGADKCARMQGGTAHRIGDWDTGVACMAGLDGLGSRLGTSWALSGVVEVEA